MTPATQKHLAHRGHNGGGLASIAAGFVIRLFYGSAGLGSITSDAPAHDRVIQKAGGRADCPRAVVSRTTTFLPLPRLDWR